MLLRLWYLWFCCGPLYVVLSNVLSSNIMYLTIFFISVTQSTRSVSRLRYHLRERRTRMCFAQLFLTIRAQHDVSYPNLCFAQFFFTVRAQHNVSYHNLINSLTNGTWSINEIEVEFGLKCGAFPLLFIAPLIFLATYHSTTPIRSNLNVEQFVWKMQRMNLHKSPKCSHNPSGKS